MEDKEIPRCASCKYSDHHTGMCSDCRVAYPDVAKARSERYGKRVTKYSERGLANIERPRDIMQQSELVHGTIQNSDNNLPEHMLDDLHPSVGLAQKARGGNIAGQPDLDLVGLHGPEEQIPDNKLYYKESSQVPYVNRLIDRSQLLGNDPGTHNFAPMGYGDGLGGVWLQELKALKTLTSGWSTRARRQQA